MLCYRVSHVIKGAVSAGSYASEYTGDHVFSFILSDFKQWKSMEYRIPPAKNSICMQFFSSVSFL